MNKTHECKIIITVRSGKEIICQKRESKKSWRLEADGEWRGNSPQMSKKPGMGRGLLYSDISGTKKFECGWNPTAK